MRLLLTALLAVLSAGAQQEETFRVDVKLVRVIATVKNAQGQAVGNLQKTDLKVFDNGAPQEISLFEKHTAQPLSVAILIDISGSTAKDMKVQTAAVVRFVSALFKEGNPEDQASLWAFNWQISQEVAWTRSASRFSGTMRHLKAEAGTALYDAIYVASEDLSDRQGRHVMVVVSDGGNTFSKKDFHAAREAAHKADAVIYPVVTMPITNDAGRNIGGENALTTFALETGGKIFAPGAEGLDEAFTAILRDLRTQYLIGYYPKNVPLTKNRFHKLEVRTENPDLHVVSRTGYYGDAEPTSNSPRK
jgi:Ca-activated chloride channel homolog